METSKNPRASVILTTYNSEHCVSGTLDSLLAQTMSNFELIVVDDSSSDNTVSILESFTDPRIRLIINEQNIGVSASRNKGVALAEGEYIFPSDHDDLSAPNRFSDQINYLERNPSVLLVASQVDFYLRGERYANHRYECFPPHVLHWMLYLRSPIVHSSICFRRDSWVRHKLQYNPAIKYADDYELYHRFADLGEIHMIPNILVTKYESGDNASFSKEKEMKESLRLLFSEKYEGLLGNTVDITEVDLVTRVCNEGKVAKNQEELVRVGEFIERFTQKLCDRRYTSDNARNDLNRAGCSEWWRVVAHYAKANAKPRALSNYNKRPFYSRYPRSLTSRVREYMIALLGLKKEPRL